jgi:hypothetical protein
VKHELQVLLTPRYAYLERLLVMSLRDQVMAHRSTYLLDCIHYPLCPLYSYNRSALNLLRPS